MILETSGTTGKPKGVVTTHANIAAQITSLVSAWEWTADDPDHQCAAPAPCPRHRECAGMRLWVGPSCENLPGSTPQRYGRALPQGGLPLFMAVPTIYIKLIDAWEKAPRTDQVQMSDGCAKMRLMVSGSAALPVSVLLRWKEITGHILLERYGMTEIGMGLSNPLHGERLPGHVGIPLPGVEVRRVNEKGEVAEPDVPGEIQVRGKTVFTEYWGGRRIPKKRSGTGGS